MPIDVPFPCPRCRRSGTARVGQQLRYGAEVWWCGDFHCDGCDAAAALDGYRATEEERRRLLQADGRWALTVPEEARDRVLLAARTLREALGLELREVPALVRAMPGQVWAGTRCEMTALARRLGARQLRCEVAALDA